MDIYPAIDLIKGSCVRLEQGDYQRERRYDSNPVDQSLAYARVGVPRVHVVDLEGARDGSRANREVVEKIALRCPVPIQFGGGIRTREDVQELIGLGVNYLILGTVALQEPERVSGWIDRWGSGRFILSLDFRDGKLKTQGWLKNANCTLEEALQRVRDWKLHQIICTDIERDGSLAQPGYKTLSKVRERLDPGVRLIAAGGVSHPDHVAELEKNGVSAAIVGRALYDGDFTLKDFLSAG